MMQLGVEGKLRGIYCEISPEVAKEYVVQHISINSEIQQALTREQVRRFRCFIGHVEMLVTDAPALIGAFYARYHRMGADVALEEEFLGLDRALRAEVRTTVNVYVWRNHGYDQRGRVESEAEDAEIARRMWTFVREKHAGQIILEIQSTDTPADVLDRIHAAAERGPC
jgi:hypothetical protein